MIDPKAIFQSGTLKATNLGASFGVTVLANHLLHKHHPDFMNIEAALDEETRKDAVIRLAKIAGVTIGIGLVAGAVGSLAASAVNYATFENPLLNAKIEVVPVEIFEV